MHNILFYDTETTDKADFKAPPDAPHQPHLVQLAAILTTPENEMVGQFCCIIKPEGWTIQPGAQEQHGISQDFAECHGIPLVKALAMFAEFEYLCCGKVCHNTDFDSRILTGAKLRKGIAEPQPVKPHFCTMKATTKICKIPGGYGGEFKWPKLREAYKFATGKELEGAHHAMNDTEACRAIYFWMKNRSKATQTA